MSLAIDPRPRNRLPEGLPSGRVDIDDAVSSVQTDLSDILLRYCLYGPSGGFRPMSRVWSHLSARPGITLRTEDVSLDLTPDEARRLFHCALTELEFRNLLSRFGLFNLIGEHAYDRQTGKARRPMEPVPTVAEATDPARWPLVPVTVAYGRSTLSPRTRALQWLWQHPAVTAGIIGEFGHIIQSGQERDRSLPDSATTRLEDLKEEQLWSLVSSLGERRRTALGLNTPSAARGSYGSPRSPGKSQSSQAAAAPAGETEPTHEHRA